MTVSISNHNNRNVNRLYNKYHLLRPTVTMSIIKVRARPQSKHRHLKHRYTTGSSLGLPGIRRIRVLNFSSSFTFVSLHLTLWIKVFSHRLVTGKLELRLPTRTPNKERTAPMTSRTIANSNSLRHPQAQRTTLGSPNRITGPRTNSISFRSHTRGLIGPYQGNR